MYRYILKRVAFLIPTILGVTLIIYAVMNITPGDPGRAVLGPGTPQADIDAYNESVLGEEREVLCEGFDGQAQMFFGRTYAESPDIDGRVYFTADGEVRPGTFVTVRFTDTMDGELTGEMV